MIGGEKGAADILRASQVTLKGNSLGAPAFHPEEAAGWWEEPAIWSQDDLHVAQPLTSSVSSHLCSAGLKKKCVNGGEFGWVGGDLYINTKTANTSKKIWQKTRMHNLQ